MITQRFNGVLRDKERKKEKKKEREKQTNKETKKERINCPKLEEGCHFDGIPESNDPKRFSESIGVDYMGKYMYG